MFYEIRSAAEDIINPWIPLVELEMNMMNRHEQYSQPQSTGNRYSLFGDLVHSLSFGFFYGVGFVTARYLWTSSQENSDSSRKNPNRGRDDMSSHHHDENRNSSSEFMDKISSMSKTLVKHITNSSYYKKSFGWLTLWTMHSYYLSFVQQKQKESSFFRPSFFWSMYPLLFTVAISATDRFLFDESESSHSVERNSSTDQHSESPPDNVTSTTRIPLQNESLCSEVDSHADENEPSLTLGTSDSLLGKSRSDSIATLNSAEQEPTSPYAQGSTVNSTRYLELLVHNVSHTDLVLNLMTLPPTTRQKVQEGEIAENPILLGKDNSPIIAIQDNDMSTTNHTKESTPRTNHQRSSWWIYNTTKSDSKAPPPPSSSTALKEGDVQTSVDEDDSSNLILCRPRFSAFDLFCRRALKVLKLFQGELSASNNPSSQDNHPFSTQALQPAVMSFPRYERTDSTRYSLVTPRPSRQVLLPVGFNLTQIMESVKAKESHLNPDSLMLDTGDLMNLRIRGRDASKMDFVLNSNTESATTIASQQTPTTQVYIDAVFLPLLSSLMRRWHEQINCKFGNGNKNVKKVIILVTGVGSPRNFTHSPTGNSTEACAELMEAFIHTLYPDVTVVRLHSKTEIFRYDENIKFATRELMPCIDAYRDAHARGESYPDERVSKHSHSSSLNPFDPDWKQTVSVTLSFADGAPARTHAIQAALRPYRPQYFHFWQLKTFWHDAKICDDDVEVHAFEDMETVPAMEIGKTNNQVQMVVAEVKKFRESFLEIVQNERNDIRQFWLRKTKKPVLAVLLVEQAGRFIMFRGTNMEVSMPTGSLCAERSVIGAAFASNPGLKREDLRMVAVLAVPLPCDEPTTLIPSPRVDRVNSRRSSMGCTRFETTPWPSEVENKMTTQLREVTRSMSVGSFASILEGDDVIVSNDDDSSLVLVSSDQYLNESSPIVTKQKKRTLMPREVRNQDYSNKEISVITSSNPMRRIKLYADGDETRIQSPSVHICNNVQKRRQKRTVLVHFSDDLNPLRPCGACK